MSRKINKINASRVFRAAAAATAALLICGFWVSAAPPGYENRRLWLANQPDGQSSYVKYYIDGKEQPASKINWVAGRDSGKAVSLSGKGNISNWGITSFQVHTMTIAGWFYWRARPKGWSRKPCTRRGFHLFPQQGRVAFGNAALKKPQCQAQGRRGAGRRVHGVSMGSGKERYFTVFNPATPARRITVSRRANGTISR